MYLKSIEIHGFKSFANKIVFEFNKGITAIVGPNGSGKSNVGDAVRWVLGEQSARQLRGAKMEDVIFSGTETRKPLGYAYVTITLNNSDHKLPIAYEEVTIARRVYRSGESEYLINGTVCRLKDVQELFLDTGIGKEGYSIIGQGQIDKILSGKPEERRELFDEAAGIVKFKKRKLAAEKNLESERLNLSRVNDILHEIDKQRMPLEKQSLTAKDYLKYRDELKVLDINMFLMEYDRIHEDQKQAGSKQRIAEHDLSSVKTAYENTKDEYKRLEDELEVYNTDLEAGRTSLNELKILKEQLEGSVNVMMEQILAAQQNVSHFQSRIESIHIEKEKKEEQLKEYDEKKLELDQKFHSVNVCQKETEDALLALRNEIEQHTKEIEQCNSEIFQLLSENSSVKTRLQRYETMLEQNNIKKVSLNQRKIKIKSEESLLEESMNELNEQLAMMEQKTTQVLMLNESMEQSVQEHQDVIRQMNTALDKLRQQYQNEKSKLVSLKNITERYEGYGSSIRKVMEQKGPSSGIIGVVADIIKVNKEYETAVEIALGGSIQNIITEDAETAKNYIEFLKKNRYGRATFLPLTNIVNRAGFQYAQALNEKGVIGLASTLIETDIKFQGILEFLLGRIVVVDHIDNAMELSKKYRYSLRIVTTEGELINPGGSMSGGAYKNTSNLLSRRREIEDGKKKILQFEQDIVNACAEIEKEKEYRESKKIVIEKNREEIQQLNISQNTARINMEQIHTKTEESLSAYREIQKESREIDSQIKELIQYIAELELSLSHKEAMSKENEARIGQLNKELEQERKTEGELNEILSSERVKLNEYGQRTSFIQENTERIRNEINKLVSETADLMDGMKLSTAKMQEKERDIQHMKAESSSYSGKMKQYESEIIYLQRKKAEVGNEHKSFFSKREELSALLSELDKELFRLAAHKEKLTEQLDDLMNYMWEEYELSYSGAYSFRKEELFSLPQLKKSIGDLKQQIKNLGDVNINAIEDYRNLMDRFELLKTQHDDIVEAEGSLQDIILELDEEMRKQFEEKFGLIKEQFDLVFQRLFGGGKGSLLLMEDEDILEAGIRIIAQPPGKKLQNMMQLSGGEKALTAISLLFAIQNLKPSPFCLLDEIEAALDDSNVTRFADYLHNMTKETQFIIITHRRGTMTAADVLYGITMQEKGVSTLVSVNLIEKELDK